MHTLIHLLRRGRGLLLPVVLIGLWELASRQGAAQAILIAAKDLGCLRVTEILRCAQDDRVNNPG